MQLNVSPSSRASQTFLEGDRWQPVNSAPAGAVGGLWESLFPSEIALKRVHWEIKIPWNQVNSIASAIIGMAEHAREGLATGTNVAALAVRELVIDLLADLTTLSRDEIEPRVQVVADAGQGNLSAVIRISDQAVPLYRFATRQDMGGTYAAVRRDRPERELEAAFISHGGDLEAGVYQRRMRGGDRVGRLPIAEKFGPSAADLVRELPGGVSWLKQQARELLVKAIMKERDRIVAELLASPSLSAGMDFGLLRAAGAVG